MRHIVNLRPLLALTCTLLLIAGCSKGLQWSDREISNGQRLLDAIEATNAAGSLLSDPNPDNVDKALTELRRAHIAAAQVDDQVLDKLHPGLQPRLRLNFQRALGRMIQAVETNDSRALNKSADTIQDFIAWYRANEQDFRWWDGPRRRR